MGIRLFKYIKILLSWISLLYYLPECMNFRNFFLPIASFGNFDDETELFEYW